MGVPKGEMTENGAQSYITLVTLLDPDICALYQKHEAQKASQLPLVSSGLLTLIFSFLQFQLYLKGPWNQETFQSTRGCGLGELE